MERLDLKRVGNNYVLLVGEEKINVEDIGMAVYGTLRKGDYNYDRLLARSSYVFEETTSIKGWKLHDFGPYPTIYPSPTDDEVVIDLFYPEEGASRESLEFTAVNTYAMEAGAGYSTTVVDIKGKKYMLFYMTEKQSEFFGGGSLIANGDWMKRNDIKREKEEVNS